MSKHRKSKRSSRLVKKLNKQAMRILVERFKYSEKDFSRAGQDEAEYTGVVRGAYIFWDKYYNSEYQEFSCEDALSAEVFDRENDVDGLFHMCSSDEEAADVILMLRSRPRYRGAKLIKKAKEIELHTPINSFDDEIF